MSNFESPIPLSDLEAVLGWVDSFKLSRPTKKINRDFSDAVLLAEILSVHYPKLVEMHNYPPRNSHALKLNNWMTLNRKVLKKLKLNLCCNTMEQLANCAPGVIERVLVMVRDKIRRDEENSKTLKDSEQNMSSGGSYYEACGEDDYVLMVPVKTRVNGVLETIQQKVVSYESFLTTKEELKDVKETTEVLKQKVEHLESLLKLKDERIEELQKQLDRKQARRKEVEALQNSLAVPFENIPSPHPLPINGNIATNAPTTLEVNKTPSVKSLELKLVKSEESKIPIKTDSKPKIFEPNIPDSKPKISEPSTTDSKPKISEPSIKDSKPKISEPSITEVEADNLDRIKSDVFKEVEIIDESNQDAYEEFKDSIEGITTIQDSIQKEMRDITASLGIVGDLK